MLVHSGHLVEVGGWYVDDHRHRVFLRRGEPAPICPRFGPARVTWRLAAPIGAVPHP